VQALYRLGKTLAQRADVRAGLGQQVCTGPGRARSGGPEGNVCRRGHGAIVSEDPGPPDALRWVRERGEMQPGPRGRGADEGAGGGAQEKSELKLLGAVDDYKKSIKIASSPELKVKLGTVYTALEKYADAEKEFDEVITGNVGNEVKGRAYTNRGLSRQREKRWKDAVADFLEASLLTKGNDEVRAPSQRPDSSCFGFEPTETHEQRQTTLCRISDVLRYSFIPRTPCTWCAADPRRARSGA